jgi:prevent-host-death family protein
MLVATSCYNVATMTEISVRELKNKLSEYVDRASRGEQIAVTKRGKVVATIGAPPERRKTLEEKLAELEAQGILTRAKEKLMPPKRRIKLRGKGPTVSEMIVEDRR